MARGRPRKAAAQVELLPPEEESKPKAVEIKHTTQWIETRPVEEAPDGDAETEFEEIETEDRPKKKNKNAIQEMRKKLRAQGVTPSSSLRLYIEKYLHSETDAGGSWAETEFCTKYATTEEHILNKDYIDAARKWGPGKYRITIRMENRIVDAFDERISAPPTAPVVQPVNPGDPNSPQVIYQAIEGQQAGTMPTLKDFMKAQREALKEQLEMAKLMREAYGLGPEPAMAPKNEEEILAGAILKQPEVIENVVGSVLKRFGGKGGESSSDPWAEVAMEAVKNGQAAQIVRTAIDALFNGVNGLFPKGANNGQAQMGNPQQPVNHSPGVSMENVQGQMHQITGEQHGSGLPPTQTGQQAPIQSHNEASQPATPEEQALAILFDHCARKAPVQIAFNRLCNYADAVNEQAPHLSIDWYIEAFGAMPTDQALDFVKQFPGGIELAALPHAKEWTEQLQKLIRESQEGEGE